MILTVVVVVGTAVALFAGTAYTLRWFMASSARDAAADRNGGHAADAAHAAISPHDHATTELLTRFFDGKACAICDRPIPPVHRTGMKPGLVNPATHETHAWDEIPNDNLSAMLETGLPLCSACQIAESFRQRHPDLVLDRDRSVPHAPPRIGAGS